MQEPTQQTQFVTQVPTGEQEASHVLAGGKSEQVTASGVSHCVKARTHLQVLHGVLRNIFCNTLGTWELVTCKRFS